MAAPFGYEPLALLGEGGEEVAAARRREFDQEEENDEDDGDEEGKDRCPMGLKDSLGFLAALGASSRVEPEPVDVDAWLRIGSFDEESADAFEAFFPVRPISTRPNDHLQSQDSLVEEPEADGWLSPDYCRWRSGSSEDGRMKFSPRDRMGVRIFDMDYLESQHEMSPLHSLDSAGDDEETSVAALCSGAQDSEAKTELAEVRPAPPPSPPTRAPFRRTRATSAAASAVSASLPAEDHQKGSRDLSMDERPMVGAASLGLRSALALRASAGN